MTTFLQKAEVVNPFAFMRRMTDELDRAFQFRPDFPVGDTYLKPWTPPIEILELEGKFVVRVDLPGLTKEDVKIQVSHDELTIEGERKLVKKASGEGLYRTERCYGKFYRNVWIPEHVKAEDARATFKDGVLEIEMPAIPVPEVNKRTVEVQG